MDRDRIAAYAQVMILALAASVIYSAPYLRQLFKTSLLDAFSLTEAQLGNLSSTYALAVPDLLRAWGLAGRSC
jgi:hypothetical protein